MKEADLAELLARRDAAAVLVSRRILQRVIKRHRRLEGLGLLVPHRKSYVLPREDLLNIVTTTAELGLPPQRALPDPVMLLRQPEDTGTLSDPGILLTYWRLLFHASIHRAFPRLSLADVQERIRALGEVEFSEVQAVLRQENFLFDPDDPVAVYEEFAAVYLELRHFDPARLRWYFPGLADLEAVDALLARDVDAAKFLAASRPEGAPDPGTLQLDEETGEVVLEGGLALQNVEADPARFADCMDRADNAAGRGNRVRSLILRRQALAFAPAGEKARVGEAVGRGVEKFATRLQKALGFPAGELPAWQHGLTALLEPAAAADDLSRASGLLPEAGWWNREARMLYDLQKVCIDREQEVFAVDVAEWVTSLFKRPLRRPLPRLPVVHVVRHLRKALGRLAAARIPEDARRGLHDLLAAALHQAEQDLRRELGPPFREALDRVGLVPSSAAEEVARDKLLQELLDVVQERGFLSIGDLRDAVARNRLKLPDLSGPREYLSGDPLLRANDQLAIDLDGIYRRGEVYLRFLQRLSSLAFGNPVGRFLTRCLAIPVGGALLTLKGIDGITEEAHNLLGFPIVLHTLHLYSLAPLALFYFGLLHVPPLRKQVLRGLVLFWRAFTFLTVGLPLRFLSLPFVRAVLGSKAWLVAYQWLVKPGAFALPAGLVAWLLGAPPLACLASAVGVFVLALAVLYSRVGMYLEEVWVDRLYRSWLLIRQDLLAGLFRWILYVSRQAVEQVERAIYAVDEWLLFRQPRPRKESGVRDQGSGVRDQGSGVRGQGSGVRDQGSAAGASLTPDSCPLTPESFRRGAFALTLVLGFFWFLITYVIRFAVNLLIEPQVNPIKHFPVVTVAHKLMFLAAPPIAQALAPRLGVPYDRALFYVGSVIWLIPGIFGFLVWELKENWRIYRANEPEALGPVMVGSHGEQVIHLLRPGFHSGTIPKLFARLRRKHGAAARRAETSLEHVGEALTRFVQRDLLAVVSASPSWQGELAVGRVSLGTTRVRIELCRPSRDPATQEEPAVLEFELVGSRELGVAFARPGWLGGVSGAQRHVWANGLAGFYKLAGVRWVRLSGRMKDEGGRMKTEEGGLSSAASSFILHPSSLQGGWDFDSVRITWQKWVEVWQADRNGEGHPGLVEGVERLVP